MVSRKGLDVDRKHHGHRAGVKVGTELFHEVRPVLQLFKRTGNQLELVTFGQHGGLLEQRMGRLAAALVVGDFAFDQNQLAPVGIPAGFAGRLAEIGVEEVRCVTIEQHGISSHLKLIEA